MKGMEYNEIVLETIVLLRVVMAAIVTFFFLKEASRIVKRQEGLVN